MDQQHNEFYQIAYLVIHNGERCERKQAKKSQYKDKTGYVGQRYRCVPGENRKYFTTRSVYTRHKEISEKYKYNFDPKQSKTLIFLKRKWNEQLFNYLSQFGKGFYVKKRSAKDKRQFKLQNGFEIKENPLFRMLSLLDKLNYLFLVKKFFHGFNKMAQHTSGKSCQLKVFQEPHMKGLQKQSTTSQTTQQDEQQTIQLPYSNQKEQSIQQQQPPIKMYTTLSILVSDEKLMKAYDSYKDQGYRGRSKLVEFYKKQAKNCILIKKTHGKHLAKESIDKIIQNMKKEYPSGSY